MPKYRVLAQYTVTEEMFVDAKNHEEANVLALSYNKMHDFKLIEENDWRIYDIQTVAKEYPSYPRSLDRRD